MKEVETNTRCIGSHYEELKRKYPDEWVAARNKSVVEHGKDLPSLVETLKKHYPEDYKQIAV